MTTVKYRKGMPRRAYGVWRSIMKRQDIDYTLVYECEIEKSAVQEFVNECAKFNRSGQYKTNSGTEFYGIGKKAIIATVEAFDLISPYQTERNIKQIFLSLPPEEQRTFLAWAIGAM